MLEAAALGWLAGLAAVGFGCWWGGSRFLLSTGGVIWTSIMATQVAFWAVIFGPLWRTLRGFGCEWRRARGRLELLAGVLLALLVLMPLLFSLFASTVDWPLWGRGVKIAIFTVVGGVLIGIPAVVGMALIQTRVSSIHGAREEIQTLIDARGDLHFFLVVAGIVIDLAVLATGALVRAATAFDATIDVGEENVLLFGAFLTTLLLFTYVPCYLGVSAPSRRLRDTLQPIVDMPDPSSGDFANWATRRTGLENLLRRAARLGDFVLPSRQAGVEAN